MVNKLRGSIPALVTPFMPDGAFDESIFRDLVEWQIAEGSSALVACGTTGEAATLSKAEHFEVVRICIEQAHGRVPVIAGAGSNDTRTAIGNVAAAKEAGADGALVVAPYYNRPNQEGLYQHFAALARGTPLPIVLYNVPSRTVADVEPATIARIVVDFPDAIVAIKDSSGLLARVSDHRARLGRDFTQLTGNDDTALAFNALGGTGCISVTANVAPGLCASFQQACLQGDYEKALRYQDQLFPLHAALFCDASPGPTKYALSRVRRGFPKMLRLPMSESGQASRAAVDAALSHAKLV